MKPQASLFTLLLWLPCTGLSQGFFAFSNLGANTRLYTTNGPLAGPGIWAEPLVGLTSNSLAPLGPSLQHNMVGLVGEDLGVPFADAGTFVQVQMAVWDGTLWGTSFAGVPGNQLGFTDIVPVFLKS